MKMLIKNKKTVNIKGQKEVHLRKSNKIKIYFIKLELLKMKFSKIVMYSQHSSQILLSLLIQFNNKNNNQL
jgi:hypothetical protein